MSEEKTRVRMGFKPNTKGIVCYDVTSEAETPEAAEQLLRDGISRFKAIAEEKGFKVSEGASDE